MQVERWMIAPALVVASLAWNAYRAHGLRKEFDRNDRFAPPSDQQIRWHIRHIREDVGLICNLLVAVVLAIIFA